MSRTISEKISAHGHKGAGFKSDCMVGG